MLRSDFAAPETPTFVQLTFVYQGRRYTVRRSPEYLRKRKRGDGVTKQKKDAVLEGSDGQVITGDRPVTEAVVELLQLSAPQFKQVAMIAQGSSALCWRRTVKNGGDSAPPVLYGPVSGLSGGAKRAVCRGAGGTGRAASGSGAAASDGTVS